MKALIYFLISLISWLFKGLQWDIIISSYVLPKPSFKHFSLSAAKTAFLLITSSSVALWVKTFTTHPSSLVHLSFRYFMQWLPTKLLPWYAWTSTPFLFRTSSKCLWAVYQSMITIVSSNVLIRLVCFAFICQNKEHPPFFFFHCSTFKYLFFTLSYLLLQLLRLSLP